MNSFTTIIERKLDKKGLRQCAKQQDLGKGLLGFGLLRGGNKVKSYFVGFAQRLDTNAFNIYMLKSCVA